MKVKTYLVAVMVCGILFGFMALMLALAAGIIEKGYLDFFLPFCAGPVWPFWILWAYFLGWTLFIAPVEFMILIDDTLSPGEKFGEFMVTGFMSVFLWLPMLFKKKEGIKILKFLKLKR
jgi:hypothetical protein